MAADSDAHDVELAERPRDGEGWTDMLQRQQQEGSGQPAYLREMMRSLPDEQKQEKDRGEPARGSLFDGRDGRQAASYHDALLEASRGAGQEASRGLDRQPTRFDNREVRRRERPDLRAEGNHVRDKEDPDAGESFCAFLLNSVRVSAKMSEAEYRRYERLARYWLEEYPARYNAS